MFHSVRSKLLAGIILPLLLISGLTIYIGTRNQIREKIAVTKQLIESSVESRAARLESEFTRIASGIDLLRVYLEENKDLTTEEIAHAFSLYINRNSYCDSLFLAYDPQRYADKANQVLYVYRNEGKVYTEYPQYYDFARHAFMVPFFTQKDFWTEPHINVVNPTPEPTQVSSFSVPFVLDGKPAGVIVADITLNDIRKIVQEETMEHCNHYLMSSTGAIISGTNREFEMHETIFSLAEWYEREDIDEWGHRVLQGKTNLTRLAASNNALPKIALWNDESPLWLASVPLRHTNWILVTAADETEMLKPVYAVALQRVLLFLIALSLAVASTCIVSFNLTRFVKQLSSFAKELTAGNMNAVVYKKRPNDEFGVIADTMHQMAVELSTSINRQLEDALARKAIEEELRVARQIQTSLLPRIFPPFPSHPEFDLYAKNEPATYIAGDFYDFFFVEEGVLALVIADVSGHGTPAAIFMAVSRTVIRNNSIRGKSVSQIIRMTNDILSQDNDDQMFVTVCICLYDTRTGELRYVNAGHSPPYIVRQDGKVEYLLPTGPLVAAFENAGFTERSTFLERDDVLVMFTDGVTEARSAPSSEMYGEVRLIDLLTQNRSKSAYGITEAIFQDVEEYNAGQRNDDVTVLVLKRT